MFAVEKIITILSGQTEHVVHAVLTHGLQLIVNGIQDMLSVVLKASPRSFDKNYILPASTSNMHLMT